MSSRSWVYLHLAADGSLLYVGKTSARQYRQRQHAASASWWPLVAEVDHLGPYDEATALDVEAALIGTHQPPHNIMGSARQPEAYDRAWMTRRAHARGEECGHATCVPCAHSADRDCLRSNCLACRLTYRAKAGAA